MLETLRNASHTWVVKILFALLILSFSAWGIGDILRVASTKTPAVVVGPVEITPEEVINEYHRESQRLQVAFGGKLTPDDVRALGLVDKVVDQMVNRTLLDLAAKDLDLAIDDDSMRRRVAATKQFHNALGQFDPQVYRQTLYSNGLSEERFLAMERKAALRDEVSGAIAGAGQAPRTLLDPLFAYRNEQRVAETILFQSSKQPTPANPADAVLHDYYQANAARFMAPEYRDVAAAVIRPADVAAGITVTEAQIAEAFAVRQGEFQEPEKRTVAQVVFDDEAQAKDAVDKAKTPGDLTAIAAVKGKDVITLGAVTAKDLPPELADSVFALTPGKASAPIHSALGWHVVKVSAVQPGKSKTLAEMHDKLKADLVNDQAVDQMFALSGKLEDALGGGASIEEAAAKLGLKVAKGVIDEKGLTPEGKPAADLPPAPKLFAAAFTTPQGSESQMTDLENGHGYFILRVDAVTPPALKPFETVKAEALTAWQAQQREAAAKAAAETAAARLKEGDKPDAVAAQLRGKAETSAAVTRTTSGVLPQVVMSELFRLPVGGVAVGPTSDGIVVARVKSVKPAPIADNAEALDQMRKQLGVQIAGDLFDEYLGALRLRYPVKVNLKVIEQRL